MHEDWAGVVPPGEFVLSGHPVHVGGVVPVHPELMYVFDEQIQLMQTLLFEAVQSGLAY